MPAGCRLPDDCRMLDAGCVLARVSSYLWTLDSQLWTILDPYRRADDAVGVFPFVAGSWPSSIGLRPIMRRNSFGSPETRRHSSSVTSRATYSWYSASFNVCMPNFFPDCISEYGMGWLLAGDSEAPRRTAGDFGHSGMFGSMSWASPAMGFGFGYVMNDCWPNQYCGSEDTRAPFLLDAITSAL